MTKNRETNVAEWNARMFWNEPCRDCGHPRHSHKIKYTHEPKYLSFRVTTKCHARLAVEPGMINSALFPCACFAFVEQKNEEFKAVFQ